MRPMGELDTGRLERRLMRLCFRVERPLERPRGRVGDADALRFCRGAAGVSIRAAGADEGVALMILGGVWVRMKADFFRSVPSSLLLARFEGDMSEAGSTFSASKSSSKVDGE